jgi:sec-independent protein translocase protein TatC
MSSERNNLKNTQKNTSETEEEDVANGNEESSQQEEAKEMSFLDHLEELRARLIYCLVSIFVAMVGSYFFSKHIIDFLSSSAPRLITLAPTGAIMARLKIALFTGFIISIPMVFYQIWKFVVPGLLKKEKKFIPPLVTFSSLFFLLGAAFSYVLLPFFIKFLLAFHPGNVQPSWEVWRYLNFVIKLVIAFGIIFQLPVVTYFLSSIGLIQPSFFKKRRKFALVIIFIVAAILTPPDIFTQLSMALPLYLLFEMSIWISWIATKRKTKRDAKEMAG